MSQPILDASPDLSLSILPPWSTETEDQIRRIIQVRLPDKRGAWDDITQNVAAAYQRTRQKGTTVHNVDGYIYRSSHNAVNEFLRRLRIQRRRERPLEKSDGTPRPLAARSSIASEYLETQAKYRLLDCLVQSIPQLVAMHPDDRPLTIAILFERIFSLNTTQGMLGSMCGSNKMKVFHLEAKLKERLNERLRAFKVDTASFSANDICRILSPDDIRALRAEVL
jgi:hypothetical protein